MGAAITAGRGMESAPPPLWNEETAAKGDEEVTGLGCCCDPGDGGSAADEVEAVLPLALETRDMAAMSLLRPPTVIVEGEVPDAIAGDGFADGG